MISQKRTKIQFFFEKNWVFFRQNLIFFSELIEVPNLLSTAYRMIQFLKNIYSTLTVTFFAKNQKFSI